MKAVFVDVEVGDGDQEVGGRFEGNVDDAVGPCGLGSERGQLGDQTDVDGTDATLSFLVEISVEQK